MHFSIWNFLLGAGTGAGALVAAALLDDIKSGLGFSPKPSPKPVPSDWTFEVNMMEPLVGWKGWHIDGAGQLYSPHNHTFWHPDKALEARCENGDAHPVGPCGCGIYAADQRSGAQGYGQIKGQVYGWGRYIRGNYGWRAQWAYPKAFYLMAGQEQYIEALKRYHVPIFIDEPLRIYNPEEEGWENGYRPTEADGHLGATEAPDASAEGDCSSAT